MYLFTNVIFKQLMGNDSKNPLLKILYKTVTCLINYILYYINSDFFLVEGDVFSLKIKGRVNQSVAGIKHQTGRTKSLNKLEKQFEITRNDQK